MTSPMTHPNNPLPVEAVVGVAPKLIPPVGFVVVAEVTVVVVVIVIVVYDVTCWFVK